MGAKMVDFGGWDMPVEYGGLISEHMAVRTGVGVFDVSHMGDILVMGKQALPAVQHISMNDASKLQVGQAHYSARSEEHTSELQSRRDIVCRLLLEKKKQ